jgi:hypothetical protein
MWPLPPSSGTCRHRGASATLSLAVRRLHSSSCGPIPLHAAPAALSRPQPPSCGPCRPLAAPATIMRPLPPSCSPCRPHAALAAVMQPLPAKAHEAWQSAGFLSVLYLFFFSLGPSSPAESAVAESGGAPVVARNLPPSAVVNPRTSGGKIRQRPAYINEYPFCTQQSCLTLTLE